MFLTHPESEFQTPICLFSDGAKQWRVVQLTLHAPWFVMTVEISDEAYGGSLLQTLLFAWEQDLIDALQSMSGGQVQSLVCMMPGWCSPTGQWVSRDIREVWLSTADGEGPPAWLVDAEGVPFEGGLRSSGESFQTAERQLLLRLNPKRRQTAARGTRPRRASARRKRA